MAIAYVYEHSQRPGSGRGAALRLCLLQGRIGRPMACFLRPLGHWPKDGPAALADGRSSSRLFTVAHLITSLIAKLSLREEKKKCMYVDALGRMLCNGCTPTVMLCNDHKPLQGVVSSGIMVVISGY